jgi:hypothetical protein
MPQRLPNHRRSLRQELGLLPSDPQRESRIRDFSPRALGQKERHFHHWIIGGDEGLPWAGEALAHELGADGRISRLRFISFSARLT